MSDKDKVKPIVSPDQIAYLEELLPNNGEPIVGGEPINFTPPENPEEMDSVLAGFLANEGKAKTNTLIVYDINGKGVERKEGDLIVLKFIPDFENKQFFRLTELDGQDCLNRNIYVRASDILYKVSLMKKGEEGFSFVPGTEIDNDDSKNLIRNEYLRFEKDLGLSLYGNNDVHKLSETVKMKSLEIFSSLNTPKDGELNIDNFLNDLKTKFSNRDPSSSIAGVTNFEVNESQLQDGSPLNTVESIFMATGNIREVMTIFMNLAKAKNFIEDKGHDDTKLDHKIKVNMFGVKDQKYLTGKAKSEDVKNQPFARAKASDDMFDVKKSDQMKDDENLALTEREKKLQKGNKVDWAEGQNVWRPNEDNDFVKEARRLLLPIKAGPSGTTDRLFQLNKFFNVNIPPEDFIALVIAYILPINAHSLVEVITAASPYLSIPISKEMANFYRGLKESSPIVATEMNKLFATKNFQNIEKLM